MKLRRIKAVQQPAHVINKKKRRRKRIFRAIRAILITALFVITAVYAALSPYFDIKQVSSDGSEHYDEAELVTASGIVTGRNGFRLLFGSTHRPVFLRFGDAEQAILNSCPYVREAKVRYALPSTVIIEVTEREASAVLDMKGTTLLIDKEGYLLEIDPVDVAADMPVIKISDLGSADLGKKLDIADEILLSAFKVFDTIEDVDSENTDKLLPIVDYVDASDPSDIRFSLQSRVIVDLGKAEDLHYKISAASSIFTENIKKTERGTLDLSIESDPVFTPESGG